MKDIKSQTLSGFSSNILVFLYVLSSFIIGAPFLLPTALKELWLRNNSYGWLSNSERMMIFNNICTLGVSSFLLSGILGSYSIKYINNRRTALLGTIIYILGWIFCFFFEKYFYYGPFLGMILWGVSTQLLSLSKSSISAFYESRRHLVVALVGGSIALNFIYTQLIELITRIFANQDNLIPGLTIVQFVILLNCVLSTLWLIMFYYIIPEVPFVTPEIDYCKKVYKSSLYKSEEDLESTMCIYKKTPIIEINRCKYSIPKLWTLPLKEQLFSFLTISFIFIYSIMWFLRLYFTINMKSMIINQTNGNIEYTDFINNIFGYLLGFAFLAAILTGMIVDFVGIFVFLILFSVSSLVILLVFSTLIPFNLYLHLLGLVMCIFCYSYFIGCPYSFFTSTYGYTHLNTLQGVSSTIAGVFVLGYSFLDPYIQLNLGNLHYITLDAILLNIFIILSSVTIALYMERLKRTFSNAYISYHNH
ncbi:uncharacterized protein CMU_038180 [Cryptosporidium muris RN66]|uniref:Major facilitator superfamily protein n=1 Tax=Cryptosporidium muris (strain RN66) TaxID=441375 RepID=B6A961_CRYMR|nr:uncharacterized protein CMU_038180 [Cryptosporidium muris RN66]EEA04752.1 hypothetical protein, conserved [Cryptosporidium muris RN66]|eukprot:XP_002139101.1 hypothetical protein [Cryptosporidium muris RN66]